MDPLDKIRQANDKRAELETKERQHKEQLDRSVSLESVLFHSFQSLVSVLEGNGDKAEAIAMVIRALDKLDKEGTDNKAELATVKAGLTELESQLKDIPTNSLKQLPKFLQQRDVIKVTNLSDLDKGFAQVEKAIKGMKLTAEAPQVSVKAPTVNVPAPIINIPETDLKPLQSAMMDVVKAVKAVKIPEVPVVDLSKLEKEAKTHTKLLSDILDKPTGGGGGGGQAWTAVNTAGIPMPLNLDADGKLITTSTGGGGGVQYTEDAASAGGETGTVALGVRRDADTSPVSADGDFHTAIYDNAGAQKVNVKTSALPSGAATAARQDTGNTSLGTIDTSTAAINTVAGAKTDAKNTATDTTSVSMVSILKQISASAQAPPSQAVTNAGTFVVQATLAAETTKVIGVTRAADGSGNLLTSTANALDINIKSGNPTTIAATQSGTWTVQPGNTANTTAWKVDGSAVTQPVSYATTGSGTATGALRVELPTNGTGIIATVGAVTAITNALPAGTNGIGKLTSNSGVTIGAVEIASAQTLATVTNVATIGTSVTPGTAATNLGKAEDAAHTTGDVGVLSLGVRNDTLADTTNTNTDYSQMSTDIKGRVMTAGAPRSLKANTQTSLSNTTTETTIITATASTFHDVYGIILANTGATTTKVSIRDDTAGTVRAIIEVPTLETRGFMLPVDSAVTQTAVNKNWTAQCGSATTALEVTAFYVSMV